jgi:hypothetical protein
MFKVYKSVEVVREKKPKGAHGEKKENQSEHMTCNLDDGAVAGQKMRPQKNQNDKDAERFKKEKSAPQDIGGGIDKFPFEEGTYSKVDSVPCAYQQISTFPYLRYVFNPFQRAANSTLKLAI